MRFSFVLALLAALTLAYFWPFSKKTVPVAPSLAKPAPTPIAPIAKPTAKPVAPIPHPAPVARPIFKQGQAPTPKPSPPPSTEDITRAKGFLPVPFRLSPAGGPVQTDVRLGAKVNGVVGQRLPDKPAPPPPPPSAPMKTRPGRQ